MCHALTINKLQEIDNKLFLHRFFLPCNSWSCKECAPVKAAKCGVKARKGFEGCKVRFMTLTAPTGLNITQMLVCLKESWNRLRTELTRGGKKLKYAWTLEAGEQFGRPHLHVLIDRFIAVRKLSKLARRCGFGKIVDIRAVKSDKAFVYVTKYLSKGMGSVAVEKALKRLNGRRVGFSRGFLPAKPKADTGTTISIERPTKEYTDEIAATPLFKRVCGVQREIVVGKRKISYQILEKEPWMSDFSEIIQKLSSGECHIGQFIPRKEREILWGSIKRNFDVYG